MTAARVEHRLRALVLARDCAALGARVRTIHHLSGLRRQEVLQLLFSDRLPPPRGRAPDTREWYYNANLLYRTHASIVVSNFRRIRQQDFPAAEALLAAYRYYLSLYVGTARISFDRAFDLAAHTEGLWIAKSPSFQLECCEHCGSESLDAPGTADRPARACLFCQLLDRHSRDPRLRAGFPAPSSELPEMEACWRQAMSLQPASEVENSVALSSCRGTATTP